MKNTQSQLNSRQIRTVQNDPFPSRDLQDPCNRVNEKAAKRIARFLGSRASAGGPGEGSPQRAPSGRSSTIAGHAMLRSLGDAFWSTQE